jgi:hypothetical protein
MIYSIYYEHEGTNEGDVVNFVSTRRFDSESAFREFLATETHVKSWEFVCEVE